MGDDLSPLGGSLVILAPFCTPQEKHGTLARRHVEVSAAESNIKLSCVIYQFGRG
jgi:hypothetical protein